MSLHFIQSRDNAQYKHVRQLCSSVQARRKAGQTVIEGVHLCQAWLDHRGMPALCVVGESAAKQAEIATMLEACVAGAITCLSLPDALFAPLSQVENGIALLFIINTPTPSPIGVIQGGTVLLDGLQDPGNLGSILRSSAAAGIAHVVCGSGTVSAWSPKVLRSAMGAHFVLNIIEDAELAPLIAAATVPVYATSSHAAMSLYQADLRQPSAWLFGQEGRGVAPELLTLASQRLIIPQHAQIESLNVAASAAICLFEQVRQQSIL